MACDLRTAAAGAPLGLPEVRVGIPSVIEAALLPGLVGPGRAAEILLTGDSIRRRRRSSGAGEPGGAGGRSRAVDA